MVVICVYGGFFSEFFVIVVMSCFFCRVEEEEEEKENINDDWFVFGVVDVFFFLGIWIFLINVFIFD